MEPNYSKIFNKKTMQAVSAFCELNKIDDIDKFIKKCFTDGFNIEKYGLLGETLNEGENDLKIDGEQEKWVEKEVIIEKRVEVPVEVIKEVEKIVEVPVEKIVEKIVEVPVEKIVTKIEYISDKTTEDELGGIITNLKNEMSKKDEELDELRHNLDELLDKPPVEIIKEVEVIKEVENNEKLKMMGETLQKLRKELSLKDKKIEELEEINKQLESMKVSQGAVYLKGSNLTRRL
jgi:predicted RNase H-like nuclease (RuvC/YqgF family)